MTRDPEVRHKEWNDLQAEAIAIYRRGEWYKPHSAQTLQRLEEEKKK